MNQILQLEIRRIHWTINPKLIGMKFNLIGLAEQEEEDLGRS